MHFTGKQSIYNQYPYADPYMRQKKQSSFKTMLLISVLAILAGYASRPSHAATTGSQANGNIASGSRTYGTGSGYTTGTTTGSTNADQGQTGGMREKNSAFSNQSAFSNSVSAQNPSGGVREQGGTSDTGTTGGTASGTGSASSGTGSATGGYGSSTVSGNTNTNTGIGVGTASGIGATTGRSAAGSVGTASPSAGFASGAMR